MPPTIEGFTLRRELGRGGFGVVHLARQDALGRIVAVKLLPGVTADDESFARFARECQALGVVGSHPNIATVHACGLASDGSGYLAMELLEGGTLAARSASAALPWQEVTAIGVALSGALETAHRVGVLHRDIKPENVLFDRLGTPKLLDFGIASVPGAFQTRSRAVSVTLAHAAPEVLAGAAGGTAADVYSLASTLFAALNGAPAFVRSGEETLVPLLARIATAPVPDLRDAGVPDGLCEVLESALAKDPAARPLSAEALGVALAEVLATHGGPVLSPPVLTPTPDGGPPLLTAGAPGEVTLSRRSPGGNRVRRGRRSVAAGVAALLVLGGGFTAYRLTDGGPAPQTAPDPGVTAGAGDDDRLPVGATVPAAGGQTRAGHASPPAAPPASPTAPEGGTVRTRLVTATLPGAPGSARSATSQRTPQADPTRSGRDRPRQGAPDAPGTPAAPPPPAAPPAAPSAPRPGQALVLAVAARTGPQLPATVTVALSWQPGSGGGPVGRFELQRTTKDRGSVVGTPERRATVDDALTVDAPTLLARTSWYRWSVRAVGPGGRSAWVPLPGVLPRLVGEPVPDALAQARAVGFRADARLRPAPDRRVRGRVFAQSLTPGAYAGRTPVLLSAYGRTHR